MYPCPRLKKNNPKYRLLIIFFHLIQPAARLYGRINHGLTPWRRRGAGVRLRYLLPFRSRTFTHWSEDWRSADDWLTDIEQQLISLKMGVKRGGPFHRWDLQGSSGLFARCRSLLTIEEHGGGKQYLRLKCRTKYARLSLAALLPVGYLAGYAALDGAWLIGGVFGTMATGILLKILTDAANAMNSMRVAFSRLPSGVVQQEQPRYKEVNEALAYELHNYVSEEIKESVTA